MALAIIPATAGVATASTPELKVMQWNVAGGNCSSHVAPDTMADRIATLAREHAVTVFGLQEIHQDQVKRTVEVLSNTSGVTYTYNFAATSCGGTRGNAIISRYTILERVSRTFTAQWVDEAEKRNVVGARIARDGLRVWLFTTHLTVKGGSDTGPAVTRAEQAREVRSFADSYSAEPTRTVVTGDFNDRPSGTAVGTDDAYAIMHQHYSDTWGAWANRTGTPDKQGYTAPTSSPDRRIDYIWMNYNSMLGVTSSGVLQSTFWSDHFPLITRFDVWCDGCA